MKIGMLIRSLRLIKRKLKTNQPQHELHWSKIAETGSKLSLQITLAFYKLLGKRLTYLLLYVPVAYYYFMSSRARAASKQYLENLEKSTHKSVPSSYQHFLSFSKSIIDKLDIWSGNVSKDQIDCPNLSLLRENVENKMGGVILTAHLGNIDIARALSQQYPNIKFNAIVFTRHAVKFNLLLKKINPNFSLDLIETDELDVAKAIQLKSKVEAGEFIVIVGDRTSTSKAERYIPASFLNKTAYFPEGPFILSAMLECPIYFMLCLKKDKANYQLVFEKLADRFIIKRPHRKLNLEKYAQQYASLLEEYCKLYPLQWFNFFNFWQQHANVNIQNEEPKTS